MFRPDCSLSNTPSYHSMQHPLPASLPLIEAVTPLLRTRRFGREIRGYPSVGSTNTLATDWAAKGAPEGAVVVAEHQTAGRGRMGRTWEAKAGHNLTFSVVLYPRLPPETLSLIILASSVAVAEAVAAFTAPHETTIKWPNDVLLDGRKCCGMLLESTLTTGQARPTVILGIGLNVNQATFPPSLEHTATSLLLTTGHLIERAPLLALLLERLEAQYTTLLDAGGGPVQKAYKDRLHGLNAPLTLHLPEAGQTVEGLLDGITETGALRLQTTDGLRTFHAGDVTTHRAGGFRVEDRG